MLTLIITVLTALLASAGAEPSLELVAGGGRGPDGSPALQAKLDGPFGVAFDQHGSMYFVEMPGNRVRRLDLDGRIRTIAGNGEEGFAGDGGPAVHALLRGPHHLVIAANDDVYIADTWNNRVRKIAPKTGIIDTIAGNGHKGFSGDGGPAIDAEFGGIYCLALDETSQKLYLADLDNRRIRAIDLRTGNVLTVAGNGQKGIPKDGDDARSAPLVDPRAVATDGNGNIYILERSGNALRVVDRSGKIRTIAGTGKSGSTGDGGDAKVATFNGPKHICVDSNGNVFIADTENHRVRMLRASDGTIHNVAGTGAKGVAGLGGPADRAELAQPHGVLIGPQGVLYISDSSNGRIVKMSP